MNVQLPLLKDTTITQCCFSVFVERGIILRGIILQWFHSGSEWRMKAKMLSLDNVTYVLKSFDFGKENFTDLKNQISLELFSR